MSWGIDFNSDIFIKSITIENQHQLDELIEETIENLKNTEKILLGMVCLTPVRTYDDIHVDIVHELDNSLMEYLEDYRDNVKKLYQLNLYKEYVEKNGFKKE